MRNLINFLLKYNYWFLFIVLEVASFVLLFRFNSYQQSTFFTSANVVVGAVYEVSGGISSYFHLKSVNEDLLDRNMALEQQITNLEKALREHQVDSVTVNSIKEIPQTDYQLFKARVIKNSLNQADNYITLDQGSSSGIRPEMGVVDGNGIVGIVYETSPSYSVVISVLNSKSNVSCKIVGSDYFGYLKWEHGDSRYAYLKDLPRHAEFNLGDTVVTSGFSTVFPEGIMVGTVDDMSDSHDGLSYLLKIKLATDFGKVSDVRVIARNGQQEQKELENKIATFTGGRAAEEIVFSCVTTGASNDIEQATKLARSMITRYGMSKDFDMVAMETQTNQYLGGDTSLTCSAETQTMIDQKVVELVRKQHEKAAQILLENREKLDEISQYLYQKETITGEEFMQILNS